MLGIKESCAGKYKAVQSGKIVYVIAYGTNPHNHYEVELEDTPEAVFPPPFRLVRRELKGKIIKVETRFVAYTKFPSKTKVKFVTVYDNDGAQSVSVEKTSNFDIDAEVKRLYRDKGIRYELLSAGLQSLIYEYEEIGLNVGAVNSSRVSLTPLFIPSEGGTPETIVSIECDENADINLPGVNINSQEGELRTAKISLDSLPVLSQHPGVRRISSAGKLSPLNDEAAKVTQLDNFRLNNGHSLTGKGVIIGIVDTGIDSLHPCFEDRILSIWDQKIEGDGWGKKDYGMVLTKEMRAASCDTKGHGTHVAGIAAGRDEKFGGVAPDANLIIVKTDFIDFHVTDAIEYIFAEADKLPDKPPVVVNLSLGGHINAHDGTDDLSKWIDAHTGKGRIVVVAAGNEGDKNIHAATDIASGGEAKIEFAISRTESNQTPPIVLFSGWYNADGSCEISIQPPIGEPTIPQTVVDNMNSTQMYVVEGMLVTLTMPATAPEQGDRGFELKIQTGAKEVQSGRWRIIVKNTGSDNLKVDMWSAVPDGFNPALFTNFIENSMKIGSPGCADTAITVASFVTRDNWRNVDNQLFEGERLSANKIASSSSPGPTRKLREKPDITAPGEFIASALSSKFKKRAQGSLLAEKFIVMRGTSMACPFITGICALLLEDNPELAPKDIKKFLKDKGRIEGNAVVNHNKKWGFGLVKF